MIVAAAPVHVEGWAALRATLWSDETATQHRTAISGWLARGDRAAFVAIEGEAVVGFAEASLRRDHVNGCDTSPVAFLEGIAVAPDWRGRGISRALVEAVEDWGSALGCRELGSDADAGNREGQALHRALGFEERERVVCYRKLLAPNGSTLS